MKQSTALLLSACLSIGAAILVATATLFLGRRLGIWQWLFYGGALLTVLGALYPFRQATWGSRRWMRSLLGRRVSPEETPAEPEETPLLSSELASMFEERLQQVEQRERELGERLAGYHQWFEFPPPLDLGEVQPSDPEMVGRDQKLDKLLERKTQELFEKIRTNEYSLEGTFQFALVRDDIYAFVGEIATLYGDDPDRPMTGVSTERVLRAAGRCCLKFLVELERLPLDIRSYDIVDVYKYVRQAVNVYGMYRSAQPYMPWLRGAYYGTWVAMGANPLALGAWWFVSSLGTKGASTLATNVANRWALSFLHDIVRVIGYEVAGIYDQNLRYRDPNWCFAAELTELVQAFPSSESSLRRSLSLVGALQLRNEYDRIFFMRCLVEGKKSGLRRAHAADLLPQQRRGIAQRLESFLKSSVPDPEPKTLARWRDGVEERLDVVLAPDGATPALPEDEQRREALRSLAGYLLEIKQVEPESLRSLLETTTIASALSEAETSELWQSLQDDPPFFFQTPQLTPGGPVVAPFVADLCDLAVRVAPRYPLADEVVAASAVRLREDAGAVQKLLDKRYVAELARLLPEAAPRQRFPAAVARAVLDLVQDDEALHFVYGDVQVADGEGEHVTGTRRENTWLVAVAERLVVFTMGESPELIWEGDSHVHCDSIKGRIRSECRLTGGRWLGVERDFSPTLFIQGPVLASSRRYFGPLQAFFPK